MPLTHDDDMTRLLRRVHLPLKLDSLTKLASSDSAQLDRVKAIRASLDRWQTEFAEPAIQDEIKGDSMLAGAFGRRPSRHESLK